jgi:hypothetical protein
VLSLVPAAIDGIVVLARRQAGVQVVDGPEVAWPEQEFIAVGLSPEDLSVPMTRIPVGLMSTSESADITCMVRSWTGDTDIRARRERAYQLLDRIQTDLDADPTLSGVCGWAQVSGSIYLPAQTSRGCVVDIVFVVHVKAF